MGKLDDKAAAIVMGWVCEGRPETQGELYWWEGKLRRCKYEDWEPSNNSIQCLDVLGRVVNRLTAAFYLEIFPDGYQAMIWSRSPNFRVVSRGQTYMHKAIVMVCIKAVKRMKQFAKIREG